MLTKHVALMRGINVGGKNRLPMEALREAFAKAGAKDVTTYIQSGNVIFSCATKAAEQILTRVRKAVLSQFGIDAPIVFRTASELKPVVHANPHLAVGRPENSLHVYFLADVPDAGAVAKLDPNRSPGDEFTVVGREIFIYLPNGSARSKLTNSYFDSKLRAVSTLRSWRTVVTLCNLAEC